MAIYLKYGDIKGSVTTSTFKDQVSLNSLQFGVGRGVSTATGQSEAREASVASVSEVTVTKEFDKSSNKFLMEALMGTGQKVEITFSRTDKGEEKDFLIYELTDCLVSGYSISSGGDRPTESISLNFAKFTSKATLADAKNENGTPDTVGWDLGLSKKV